MIIMRLIPRSRIKQFLRLLQVAAVLGAAYYFINYFISQNQPTNNAKKDSSSINVNNQFYTQCSPENKVMKDFFGHQERLVHLDLKGAPPKIEYFKKVFPLFRDMGATGLLIEYEDSFPYSGELKVLAGPNAYTESDIKELLNIADANQLTTVIPLVQTFGHMEFVLKHDVFKDLREVQDDTRSILPDHAKSLTLIREMIKQVAYIHPTAKFFHIGSDEVYNLGQSQYSKAYMAKAGIGRTELFLRHVVKVASFVKGLGYRALAWDDMFRTQSSVEQLRASRIGELLEPMVWLYEPHPETYISPAVWDKYSKIFEHAWIASAFKGATGQAQYITDIRHHLTNHHSWVKIMKRYGKPLGESIQIRGAILTGWQRYDHYKPLCELLPVALPSLAFNLQLLKHGCFTREMHKSMSVDVLKCRGVVDIDLKTEVAKGSETQCAFPGRDIYYGVHALYALQNSMDVVVDGKTLGASLRRYLAEIYDEKTVSEWLRTVKL